MGAREPISKAKTDQQVPGAAGNSGDLPEPQNIGLLDRASQHHNSGRSHEAWPLLSMLAKRGYSQTAPQLTQRSCLTGKMSPPRLTNKTPPNPKTSGSWIKPPSTTTLGEGRWETGWTSAEKTEGLANSQRLVILHEIDQQPCCHLYHQVGHEPPLYQLTHERLIHESQATQPPLVMLAFQRMINRALGNNSSRHEYVS
ncbi:hypothetical protein SKAU_G00342040 [Synaphobranchus kaupii]|uniref:Uncharacterized protein n=1 Tax=Synaphobranchus kaupii TaxID=118154 RepID=A0A9Q1ENA4_SYNKA|nr:hypothetical protein SKAU_G00342040 [Synaphobranchus kaupii]